jgi:hypothetical protein
VSRQIWIETVITADVNGPTLTAAAAASMLPGAAKYTFPAGTFDSLGTILRVTASGRVSTVITTPGNLRFDVRLGGTVVFDSQTISGDPNAAYTNVGWYLDMLLTIQVDGTLAQFWGQGKFCSTAIAGQPATPPKGALTAPLPFNTSPLLGLTFDSTSAQQFDMFFTQTVGTGSMTLHQLAVELAN